jgi:hypothetical protein
MIRMNKTFANLGMIPHWPMPYVPSMVRWSVVIVCLELAESDSQKNVYLHARGFHWRQNDDS